MNLRNARLHPRSSGNQKRDVAADRPALIYRCEYQDDVWKVEAHPNLAYHLKFRQRDDFGFRRAVESINAIYSCCHQFISGADKTEESDCFERFVALALLVSGTGVAERLEVDASHLVLADLYDPTAGTEVDQADRNCNAAGPPRFIGNSVNWIA
jgi:hypothetical protein